MPHELEIIRDHDANRARQFAILAHGNQRYGHEPYCCELEYERPEAVAKELAIP